MEFSIENTLLFIEFSIESTVILMEFPEIIFYQNIISKSGGSRIIYHQLSAEQIKCVSKFFFIEKREKILYTFTFWHHIDMNLEKVVQSQSLLNMDVLCKGLF